MRVCRHVGDGVVALLPAVVRTTIVSRLSKAAVRRLLVRESEAHARNGEVQASPVVARAKRGRDVRILI